MVNRIDKNQRCSKHSEFDPSDKEVFKCTQEYRNCSCCCGLRDAVERIGKFAGEYTLSNRDEKRVVLILTPTSFENFGHLRHSLGWHYHFDDEPSWYVEPKTCTIHFTEQLPAHRLFEYVVTRGLCTAQERSWSEPVLVNLDAEAIVSKKYTKAIKLTFTIGNECKKISLVIYDEMNKRELLATVSDFCSEIHGLPDDNVVLTDAVLEKK